MIDFMTNSVMAEQPVVASCLPASDLRGTGLSGAGLLGNERIGSDRPTKAPAAAAQASAYALGFPANGAGVGRQQKQHFTMWAFRGHEPWRDPA